MLKPIVKECIQESLLEGGLLSGVIAEVIRGFSPTQTIVEDNRQPQIVEKQQQEQEQEQQQDEIYYTQKLNETKKKMLDAIGKNTYNGVNLFENTEPISSAPAPGESIAPTSPLSGRSANDSGVNIDGLLGSVGKNWGRLAKGNK